MMPKRSKRQIGDGPIQPDMREHMNDVARALDRVFNGEAKGTDRKVGFVLLTFPFGATDGRCNYISNGARDEIKRCGASSPLHFDRKENLDDSWNRRADLVPAPPSQAQPDVTEAMVEAMVEAENVLVSLSENVAKHGNYTPESTVLFVGQALSAVRAALSAREGGGK